MTTETNNIPDDSFDAAFAEVVAAMDAAPASVTSTAPAAPVEPPEAKATAPVPAPAAPVEPPEAKPEAQPVPAVPAAPVPPAAPAPATPVAAAEDKAGVQPVPAAPVPPPAPAAPVESAEAKAAREAFEASIAPYTPSDDEVKAMEQFKKDFPNEAVAIEARLKSVDRDINARIHQAVKGLFDQMNGRLAPVEQTVTKSAVDTHFATIRAAHSDYDAIIAKVPEWIKTLPAYARAGAQDVYNQGSTQEVIEMIADYKKANGLAAPSVAPPPPAPAAKPTPSGADDLAPVSSRRTAVTPKGAPDPNDFYGAFAEAAANS